MDGESRGGKTTGGADPVCRPHARSTLGEPWQWADGHGVQTHTRPRSEWCDLRGAKNHGWTPVMEAVMHLSVLPHAPDLTTK